ncbi:hypothetical protein HYALB_00007827 [Hymenoscyphus albidus]|uniref:Extracellular membrane protein CFEM domain-containing protein n=1 Tax=Hymenoscyphus albidus TaxID=595503 RepID=A0A9N9Q3A5_9HELO|nr:hypothetical protein HYALB_00007827 [Hymenoscyphus albidus]
MRMARCWPGLILLTSTFIPLVNGATTLPSEVTAIVPQCAQPCLSNFVETNFPSRGCGSSPTLECLCSHDSASEYTIGEAGVQCIVGSQKGGLCTEEEARDSVVSSAFGMCSGQVNAISNTHTVIYVTLEIQSSSVRIGSPTTVASTTESETPSSTFATSTRPSSASVSSTSSSMSSASSSSSILSATSTQTGGRQSQTPAPTREPNLTNAQIVGITVAAIGGGALMLGIIVIMACVKRRRVRQNRDSDDFSFQVDPKKYPQSIISRKSRKSMRRLPVFGPGGTSNGIAARVAPPIPPRIDTMSPNMFSRRSIQPDQVIGLAISPERNIPAGMQSRESKLLPPRPTLKLQMPPNAAGASFSKNAPKPMTFGRSSAATQFEEDYESTGWKPQVPTLKGAGIKYPKPAQTPSLSRESTATQFEDVEDNIRKSQIANARGVSYVQPALKSSDEPRGSTTTQFEEDDARISKLKVDETTSTSNRPKNNLNRRSTVEEDVDSAIDMWQKFSPINTTGPPAFYYRAADGQRAQQLIASSTKGSAQRLQSKPVLVGDRIGSFSQPRRPNEYPPRAKGDNLELDAFPRPPTLPASLQIPIPPGASRGVSATSSIYTTRTTSLQPSPTRRSNNPAGSFPQVYRAYKQVGPYDAPKTSNSMTSYEIDKSRLSPGGPRTDDLSPVVESPASGRSPVSYPKIPKPGRLSEATIRMVPPPAQPNFKVSNEKPWRVAELAAQRQRQLRRNSSLTGPPQGIDINVPQPRTPPNYTPQSPNWDTYTPSPLSPSGPSFSSSNLPFARQNQPPIPLPTNQQYAKQFQPSLGLSQKPGYASISSPTPPQSSPTPIPTSKYNPTTVTVLPTHARPSSGLSHISEASLDAPSLLPPRSSTTSQSSQLFSRRRGAATGPITLSDSPSTDAKKKWRVLKGEDVNAAKSPGWKTMLGSSAGMLSPQSAGFSRGRREFESVEGTAVELPGTPGWVPRLTPTRKGEDLYLRVG